MGFAGTSPLENLHELSSASCPTQDADSSPQGSLYFWVWGSQAKALFATGRKKRCEIFTFVEIRKKSVRWTQTNDVQSQK